jgi:hypothetical protein
MAGLPGAAGGLVRLGPHVRCFSGAAESVAIARAERNRAQRKNRCQEQPEDDERHDDLTEARSHRRCAFWTVQSQRGQRHQ